jgi:hypothetical protein
MPRADWHLCKFTDNLERVLCRWLVWAGIIIAPLSFFLLEEHGSWSSIIHSPTICFCFLNEKIKWNTTMTVCYASSMAALRLRWQTVAIAMEIIWPPKSNKYYLAFKKKLRDFG